MKEQIIIIPIVVKFAVLTLRLSCLCIPINKNGNEVMAAPFSMIEWYWSYYNLYSIMRCMR